MKDMKGVYHYSILKGDVPFIKEIKNKEVE